MEARVYLHESTSFPCMKEISVPTAVRSREAPELV